MGCCVSVKNRKKDLEFIKAHQFSSPSPPNKSTSLQPGQFVRISVSTLAAKYEILKPLGDGAYGSVSLASHRKLGLLRAIKSLPLSTSTEEDSIMAEIEIMKELDHPNIVRIYEVIKDATAIHIVMEYCEGGELFERIVNKKHLTESLAAKHAFDLISAMIYLKNAGIVHRDLKPENLLFESSEEDSALKLADFGTAVHLAKGHKLDCSIGTSYYIAPEVLLGNYDQKCDVWSAGVILYILLSGRPPFNGKSDEAVFHKILKEPLDFPGPVWDSISRDAKNLLVKMLKKVPEERLSFEDLVREPWLQKHRRESLAKSPVSQAYFENLAAFNVENKLLEASLVFIVSQLLTKQEEQKLVSLFKSIDTNGDGRLSKEELTEAFQTARIAINVEQILEQADCDGNGYIDYHEFLVATINWETVLNRERLYEVFKIYDLDGNGQISLDEIQAVLGGEGNDSILTGILSEADLNGDGVIDFQEFSAFILKKMYQDPKEHLIHNRI